MSGNPVRNYVNSIFADRYPELVSDVSGWRKVSTKNWGVSGGRAMTSSFKAIFGGEAKILLFTNLDLNKTAGVLLTSGSVGAQVGLHADTKAMTALFDFGSDLKEKSARIGYNPLDFSPDAKVRCETPFCFGDLHGAMSAGWNAGATFGVEAALALSTFFNGERKLFNLEEATVQGTIGAEVNLTTWTAGLITDLRGLPANERVPINSMQKNIPYQYRSTTRPAGGF